MTKLELRQTQKSLLGSLLVVKKDLISQKVDSPALQSEIMSAITSMSEEDIAWVEKVLGVRALD
ncbi:MAG: hypothetical protein LBE35_01525 [Clostridiales bacterium]|jgi:trans-2-enoyl-CoA reductase|nr:hypothetical protein [Clostridiales bacterium]